MNIQHNQQQDLSSSLPFVSIVIPCRNEASCIQACLSSILVQDYPSEKLELLIVDGMSDDGTREMIEGIIARSDAAIGDNPSEIENIPTIRNIRMLDNAKRVVPSALNIGLRESKGDIIVRIDGHAIIEPNYISTAVDVMKRSDAEVVGGLMRPIGTGWKGKSIAVAHNLWFGLGGGAFHHSEEEVEADTVYMGVFRRDVFEKSGYFDEDLVRNQDIEMNSRIRRGGGKVVLSPLIRSKYFCRNSLAGLWKQNYANGLWLIPTVKKNSHTLSSRHFIPLVFVSAFLISLFGSVVVPEIWMVFFGIMGVYGVASLGAATRAAARYGWRFLFSLPFVFATLHFSYGAGSLVGLFRLVFQGAKVTAGTKPGLESSSTGRL